MAEYSSLGRRFWRRRSPQERLLLCCARLDFSDAWRARACRVAAASRVDWPEVLRLAVLHQVTPLIYQSLAGCPDLVEQVPGEVIGGFRRALALNVQRKRELADALDAALDYFADRGIDVLLVKGTALDARIGDTPWHTVSQDVDILLRGTRGELPLEVKEHMVHLNRSRPPVDVHCERHSDLDMNGLLPIDYERVFAAATKISLRDRPAFLMSPEDELVCAGIQSFRKRFFRLKSLFDIHTLISRNPALSWDGVTERARSWRCAWIAYVALVATHVSLGCELPGALRRRLGVPFARAALLHALIARMSCRTLASLYLDRSVRGKRLSPGLLLPYASQPWGQLLRSIRIVSRQMRSRDR